MDTSEERFMEELYREYKSLMFATAGKYISGTEEREDVVHDALLRLLKRPGLLQSMNSRSLPGYIVYTVRSAAVDHLRRQKKRTELVDDAGAVETVPGREVSMDDRLILADEVARLKEVWPRLSEEERLLLEGKYIWGCSDHELAEQVHCKDSSIRMKLTRARRKALAELEDGKEGQTHE